MVLGNMVPSVVSSLQLYTASSRAGVPVSEDAISGDGSTALAKVNGSEISGDRVRLSDAAKSQLAKMKVSNTNASHESEPQGEGGPENERVKGNVDAQKLTKEEEQVVAKLKARDLQVRAHEQAHIAAAGPYARGGPRYDYQTGPDGKQYAIGGEVSIDVGEIPGDPEATLRKAIQVRRAALAPAEPSTQDRRVAAEAVQLAAKARMEIADEMKKESTTQQESSANDNQGLQIGEPKIRSALELLETETERDTSWNFSRRGAVGRYQAMATN